MQNDIKLIKNKTGKTKRKMNKSLHTGRTYKILRGNQSGHVAKRINKRKECIRC